jgi:hypothetical protein
LLEQRVLLGNALTAGEDCLSKVCYSGTRWYSGFQYISPGGTRFGKRCSSECFSSKKIRRMSISQHLSLVAFISIPLHLALSQIIVSTTYRTNPAKYAVSRRFCGVNAIQFSFPEKYFHHKVEFGMFKNVFMLTATTVCRQALSYKGYN